MLCDQSFLSKRAVLGCEADGAVGFEFFLHGDKGCGASAEQNGRAYSFGGKAFAEVEEITFHDEMPGMESNFWLSTIILDGI